MEYDHRRRSPLVFRSFDQMVYLWTVINPSDEDRVTTVLDLKGVTLASATKADTIVFIKQCVTMMSTHYPEVRVWVGPFGGFALYCRSVDQ